MLSKGKRKKSRISKGTVRMKLCATCRHFPREISPENSVFLEEMIRQHISDILQGWSDAQTLRFVGRGRPLRLDSRKIRFFELNSPVWCAYEKAMVSAAELACFVWKPRRLDAKETRLKR